MKVKRAIVFLEFLDLSDSKCFQTIQSDRKNNMKGKQLKISEQIYFKMLELERESAAITKMSTPEALFVILIIQHTPFLRN